jgi:hypothetical protein
VVVSFCHCHGVNSLEDGDSSPSMRHVCDSQPAMQASPKVVSQRNHYLKQHLAEAEAEAEQRHPDTIESCLMHSFSDWRIRDTRQRRHLTLQGLDMSIASSRHRHDT